MKKHGFPMFLYIVFFIITCHGCSRVDVLSSENFNSNPQLLPVVGVSDWDKDGVALEGMGILGMLELCFDEENLKVESLSLRIGGLTDVLETVDITNFLQIAPCTDCVKIRSVSLNADEQIVVSLGVRHPFEAGDSLKPITGRNRADLHVFNIEGIVISDDNSIAFPGISQNVAEPFLVNADGYSGYLDEKLDAIFPSEATVHPYILHFDDYSIGNFDPLNPMGFASVTNPPPSGNLVMAMGCDYDFKDYIFDFDESGVHHFMFAVGCTYGVSAESKSSRFNPEYRIPQHNKKAASEVSIEIISNNLQSGDVTSSADVEVRVVDISHGVDVGSALDQMRADSSVSSILIEVPGVTSGPISIDGSSSTSGSGHDPSDPLIYPITIENSVGGLVGSYTGLIKVLDSYLPGQNESPLLNGMDGIQRVGPTENPLTGLFVIDEFATYQAFSIDVLEPSPQVFSIDPDDGELDEVLTGVLITGQYFASNAEVTLVKSTGGTPVDAVSEIVDPSGNSLTCTIDLDSSNFQIGLYDVIVTNPSSGLSGELNEGFEVLEGGCQLSNGFTYVQSLNGMYGNFTNANYDICGSPWAAELFMITSSLDAFSRLNRYLHAYPDTDPVVFYSGSNVNMGFFAPVNGVEPVFKAGSTHPYCVCILRTASMVVSTYEYFPSTHAFTYLGDAGVSAGQHRAGCSDPDTDTLYVLYSNGRIYPFRQMSSGLYNGSTTNYITPLFSGNVFDMVFCKYDQTIIMFTDTTPGGTLLKINAATGGTISTISNVLPGTGHEGHGDVVIDNSDFDQLLCRLVVVGGLTDINMTRVLADFSDQTTFTIAGAGYGVGCAALSIGNHRLFIKEYGRPDYIDVFDPPIGW